MGVRLFCWDDTSRPMCPAILQDRVCHECRVADGYTRVYTSTQLAAKRKAGSIRRLDFT